MYKIESRIIQVVSLIQDGYFSSNVVLETTMEKTLKLQVLKETKTSQDGVLTCGATLPIQCGTMVIHNNVPVERVNKVERCIDCVSGKPVLMARLYDKVFHQNRNNKKASLSDYYEYIEELKSLGFKTKEKCKGKCLMDKNIHF